MRKRLAILLLSGMLAVGMIMPAAAVQAEAASETSGSEDKGGIGGLLDSLFGQDGMVSDYLNGNKDLSDLFGEDGDLNKILGENGDLANLFGEGELSELINEYGGQVSEWLNDGEVRSIIKEIQAQLGDENSELYQTLKEAGVLNSDGSINYGKLHELKNRYYGDGDLDIEGLKDLVRQYLD